MWLVLVITLPACRAAAPHGETPLHLARVYNGTPLRRTTTTFASTNADLLPIENSMRASFAFGGSIGPTGFSWDFEGNTEDYNPLIPGPLSHLPRAHGPAAPIAIASYTTLQSELATLANDATLSALLGAVTLPSIPVIAGVQDLSLRFAFESSRASWLPVAPGTPPAAPPTLRFDLPLELRDIDLVDFADFLFDVGPYTLPVTVDIAATPCGDCTNPGVACTDAPNAVVAAAYRTGIASALGYASGDVNATYPDIGLNLTVTTGPPAPTTGRLPGVSGGTSFTAACPFVLGDFNSDALLVTLSNALGLQPLPDIVYILVDIARVLLSPLRYYIGLVVCEIVTDIIDNAVRVNVGRVPSSLGPVFGLMVNPPVLTRTLSGLPAGTVPGLPAGTIADRIVAQIALNGGPTGAPPGALTGAAGGYTDALFNTLAVGGSASTVTVANLQPLINACATGVGLSPPAAGAGLDALVCGACQAGGFCVTAPPGGVAPCPVLCAGGAFVPNVVFNGPTTSATCTTGGICIASAPNLASLLATTPQFGETIRRWFATPLPAGARYSAATTAPAPGTVSFSYIVDPDDDCAPEETDTCIGVFDPLQIDDGDGDDYGAACDRCPGVTDSSPAANRDFDGDGIANGCDCDIDGDGCNNEGVMLVGGGGIPCVPGPDGIFDLVPASTSPSPNFDGDGLLDDCDNDIDNDTVLDHPFDDTLPDNCPRGDGDMVFEPGVTADQDPDQSDDYGGPPAGDVCDGLCAPPRPPGCFSAPGLGGGGSSSIPGFAGFDECVGLSGGVGTCDLLAFLDCEGADYDRCWRPDAFDTLILTDIRGLAYRTIDPRNVGMSAGISSASVTVPDLDGDGLDDFALAAPHAEICPDGKPCLGVAGMVGVFSSRSGKLLARERGPDDAARFGAGMASLGDALAVGAPGANGDAGALYLYRVGVGGLELVRVIEGTAGSRERFGADVALAFGADTSAPSFLVGAPGARNDAGELRIADASRGVTERFAGPVPGGRMSRGVVVATGARGSTVVGAFPTAEADRGGLAFYSRGRLQRVHRGAPGARLGERVVLVDTAAGTEVFASAPGGATGAVLRFTTRGETRSTITGFGSLFGTGLSAPGDLNGDGWTDLVIAYALDPAGVEMRSFALYELDP